MWKTLAILFGAAGVILFLLSTGFLTNWSETALINGSFALAFGGFGALGAYLGRSSKWKAFALALALAIFASASLTLFYSVIWPML